MSRASTDPQPMTVAFSGGLDMVTPAMLIPAGRVIAAVNYEPRAEGYSRIDGIDRLDGRTKPSDATYWIVQFSAATALMTAGQTVTGGNSAATGVLLADAVILSGDIGTGDAAGFVALADVAGGFQAAEPLMVGGVTKATCSGPQTDRAATDDDLDGQYLAAAVVRARNAIQPVPGDGPVRGAVLCKRDSNIYAFRDDIAHTKCPMWRATPTGWQAVPLGYSLSGVATGATAIVPGNVVTGATSGATGTVLRVLTDGGLAWANAVTVRLILSATAGTFVANEGLKVGGAALATAAGAATDNTPAAGGRFECINKNFYGATSLGALYGVNGVSPAFEFDGTIFTPIITGAPIEAPQHVAAHQNHLFLSYPNGSVQGSQAGLPQGWNGTMGAFAGGVGDDITGLVPEVAGVMAIFCRTAIYILSGSGVADFAIAPFADEAGAIEWTMQTMGGPTFMDQGGVRNLTTSQAFGNFKLGTLTQLIQPLIDNKRKVKAKPVASLRVRDKGHYRLYFSDGTGIAIFIGAKQPSILPFDYGARIPRCTFSSIAPDDDETETEVLLMGCDDGFVYQIDKGTSMDGENINAFLRPAFNHCGSPGYNKRFHRLTLQASSGLISTLFMTADFSDGDPDQPAAAEQAFSIFGGGGFWNENNWNQFLWSSRVIGKATADLDGIGNNFSPTIGTSSATEGSHTLSSYTVLFSMRGPVKA